MKALTKKGASTIKNDGLKVFATRTFNYLLVKMKRWSSPANKENIEKWRQVKDKYKGKRIFIVGNGPSLNQTPLYFLNNEYTMCFNRFNLMLERLDWKPTVFGVTDDLVIKDMYQEINREMLPLAQYAFFPDIHPSNVVVKDYIENRENVYWIDTDIPAFSHDLPKCGINKTVVNAGIQVAAFMGFTEIYLIGVDVTFGDQKVKKLNSRNWEADENDPNHFDPRYFEKGRKYHNPTVHEMIEKFAEAKEFFDKSDVKIYNAGIGGKLEVFPRVDFYSLFNKYSDQETTDMLVHSSVLNKGITYETLAASTEVVEKAAEYPAVFKAKAELGLKLIPELISTYTPMGPYKGTYFFVKK